MASTRDANITSYFQPKDTNKDSDKGKKKAPTNTNTNTTTSTSPKQTTTHITPATKRKTKNPALPPAKHPKPNPSPPTPNAYHTLLQPWTPPPPPTSPLTLTLTIHKGDLFAAPPGTLLLHACNTLGHWGAGIAAAFKARYPRAYALHSAYCKSHTVPTGSAHLIAPVDPAGHWIGCLYTSARYGRRKDPVQSILSKSGEAMEQVLELVRRVEEQGGEVGKVRMCRINSGLFGVEWERTREVLEGISVREGWREEVQVWEI